MIYIAARAGYDYVSIRTIHLDLPGEPNYALTDNPQMLKQTKQALASTGLRVHDIELARVYEGVHPTRYLPAMEVAAELGAKAVLSSIWGGERDFYREVRRNLRSRETVRADRRPRVRPDRSRGQPGAGCRCAARGQPEQRGPDGRYAPLPPRPR